MAVAGWPRFAIPSLELAPKDDPGLWPECGAACVNTLFANAPKVHLLKGYFDAAGLQKTVDLRLTRLRAEAYIPAIGVPPASCWRDDAPLKLLTGTVKWYPMVLGCMGFDDPPGDRRWGFRFPGCLKSESEERETWTAEPLRAASRG